jgi:hypothetical protein
MEEEEEEEGEEEELEIELSMAWFRRRPVVSIQSRGRWEARICI